MIQLVWCNYNCVQKLLEKLRSQEKAVTTSKTLTEYKIEGCTIIVSNYRRLKDLTLTIPENYGPRVKRIEKAKLQSKKSNLKVILLNIAKKQTLASNQEFQWNLANSQYTLHATVARPRKVANSHNLIHRYLYDAAFEK